VNAPIAQPLQELFRETVFTRLDREIRSIAEHFKEKVIDSIEFEIAEHPGGRPFAPLQ